MDYDTRVRRCARSASSRRTRRDAGAQLGIGRLRASASRREARARRLLVRLGQRVPAGRATRLFCPSPRGAFRGVNCSDAAGGEVPYASIMRAADGPTRGSFSRAAGTRTWPLPWMNVVEANATVQYWWDDRFARCRSGRSGGCRRSRPWPCVARTAVHVVGLADRRTYICRELGGVERNHMVAGFDAGDAFASPPGRCPRPHGRTRTRRARPPGPSRQGVGVGAQTPVATICTRLPRLSGRPTRSLQSPRAPASRPAAPRFHALLRNSPTRPGVGHRLSARRRFALGHYFAIAEAQRATSAALGSHRGLRRSGEARSRFGRRGAESGRLRHLRQPSSSWAAPEPAGVEHVVYLHHGACGSPTLRSPHVLGDRRVRRSWRTALTRRRPPPPPRASPRRRSSAAPSTRRANWSPRAQVDDVSPSTRLVRSHGLHQPGAGHRSRAVAEEVVTSSIPKRKIAAQHQRAHARRGAPRRLRERERRAPRPAELAGPTARSRGGCAAARCPRRGPAWCSRRASRRGRRPRSAPSCRCRAGRRRRSGRTSGRRTGGSAASSRRRGRRGGRGTARPPGLPLTS